MSLYYAQISNKINEESLKSRDSFQSRDYHSSRFSEIILPDSEFAGSNMAAPSNQKILDMLLQIHSFRILRHFLQKCRATRANHTVQ